MLLFTQNALLLEVFSEAIRYRQYSLAETSYLLPKHVGRAEDPQ
jgi:hypothetical protein